MKMLKKMVSSITVAVLVATTLVSPFLDLFDDKFILENNVYASSDIKAPEVIDLTMDKHDVTVGDIITVTLTATDETGIYESMFTPMVSFKNESGIYKGIYLKKKAENKYVGTLEITSDFANGKYGITSLSIEDTIGNNGTDYNPELKYPDMYFIYYSQKEDIPAVTTSVTTTTAKTTTVTTTTTTTAKPTTATTTTTEAETVSSSVKSTGITEITTVFSTAAVTTVTTDESELPVVVIVLGDTNNDGELNIRDAALISRKLAQGKGKDLSKYADFNGDGIVNIRDAAAIARYLANRINM